MRKFYASFFFFNFHLMSTQFEKNAFKFSSLIEVCKVVTDRIILKEQIFCNQTLILYKSFGFEGRLKSN